MTDEPTNLVLEHLRAIREEMGDTKVSMKELASTQAAILQIVATQENRLLRIEGDISLIKKRLNMVDA